MENFKFQVGDVVRWTGIMYVCRLRIVAINPGPYCYAYEVVENENKPGMVGSRGNVISTLRGAFEQKYYVDTPQAIEKAQPIKFRDCLCSSRDLLHKGCSCGYAKALGNQWGLR